MLALSARRARSISIVIPVYNEAQSLPQLYRRLEQVLGEMPELKREYLFVDDGSRDDSFTVLVGLRMCDPNVRILRFARNFGKEAAMAAGLQAAGGDVAVLIDADLQHPPELIPAMLETWRNGIQIVTAVRRSRDTDSWIRRTWSRMFYKVTDAICDVAIPDGAGDFRLLDRAVVDAINALPERNRFLKGLMSWVGFSQETIAFDVAPRHAGVSAFSFVKLTRYALDGIVSFSMVPIRMWGMIGILAVALSALAGLFMLGEDLDGGSVPDYAPVMIWMTFLSGLVLMGVAAVGEYVGRVFIEVRQRPLFVVADRVGFSESAAQHNPVQDNDAVVHLGETAA